MTGPTLVELLLLDVPVDSPPPLQPFETVLAVEERAALARLLRPEDRIRGVFARAVLRTALARRLHCTPGEVPLMRGPLGKPCLAQRDGPIRSFNLSHSGHRIAVALSAGPDVGVDVEQMRSFPDRDGMADVFMSPAELAAFRAQAPQTAQDAFLTCWVAKEALLKGIGCGMMRDPRLLHAGIPPCPLVELPDAFHWTDGLPGVWQLRMLAAGADYRAALAIGGDAPTQVAVTTGAALTWLADPVGAATSTG